MKIQTKQIMSFRFYLSNDFIQIVERTLNYVEMDLFKTALAILEQNNFFQNVRLLLAI